MPVEMLGKSILEKHGKSEANEVVLHELRARKALLHEENYRHSYPHCWRSKTPIIFRAMDQWFIEIDHAKFRERALEEINRVNWVPDWGKARIEAAVKGRPDWCISRQRTWGVPIPAFYDAQGNPILDARIVRNAAALVEKHGSNVWFEQSAAELWATLKPAGWTGPEPATKSNDTLDVWIDSGSSSRAVIARREELRGTGKPFQCEMYLEGSDQHRGWFQSSLLLSLAGNGAAPYKTERRFPRASRARSATRSRRPPTVTSRSTARTSCAFGFPRRTSATTSSSARSGSAKWPRPTASCAMLCGTSSQTSTISTRRSMRCRRKE
jgi:isoleucyl-tRNA synthetase